MQGSAWRVMKCPSRPTDVGTFVLRAQAESTEKHEATDPELAGAGRRAQLVDVATSRHDVRGA